MNPGTQHAAGELPCERGPWSSRPGAHPAHCIRGSSGGDNSIRWARKGTQVPDPLPKQPVMGKDGWYVSDGFQIRINRLTGYAGK